MAREEQDREDLLAEATALVERAELRWHDSAEPLVIGFRRDGSASVFFGGDPAYHFNSRSQLRRAYWQGLLYKAEKARLVSLRRRRVPGEVHLLRHELSDEETEAFLHELSRRLTALRAALSHGGCRIVGQVPESFNSSERITHWLNELPLPPAIAAAPHVGK